MKTLKKLIITMRPAQWVKNLFVAAPALFAKDHALVDPSIFLKAAFATGTFILIASSVYILNDVLDIEKDRLLPVKSKRPVASGELSIQAALAGGLISLSIAVVLGYSHGPIFYYRSGRSLAGDSAGTLSICKYFYFSKKTCCVFRKVW